MNKGGKNYIILPTLVDIEASASNYAASTSVFCPYKVYGSHHGFKDEEYNGSSYIGSEGFFQEVVGIVPSKLIDYHTGAVTVLQESNLTTFIDKIRYHYLSDGHKIITIVYNQSGFADQVLREIEFKILFEDGDFHTVRQFVIDSRCLDANIGLSIGTRNIFKSEVNSDGLLSDGGDGNRHPVTIDNTGPDKSVLSFYTQSYTDPKWNGEQDAGLIPSNLNNDFWQLLYVPTGMLDYSAENLNVEQTMLGQSGQAHNFAPSRLFYTLRQHTNNGTYNWDAHSGLEGGTVNSSTIDPISQYEFKPKSLQAQGFLSTTIANTHCYKSLEFYSTINTAMGSTGLLNTSNDIFQPTVIEVAQRSVNNELNGGQRGYCGSPAVSDPLSGSKCGAFYVDTSGSNRKFAATGKRIDLMMYGLRKLDGSTFSGPTYNTVDFGYDTQGGLLREVALTLMQAAEEANNADGNNVGMPSQYGVMTWKALGTPNSAANMLDCNILSPSDLISNFILGRHTFYLSRPHHLDAGTINTHHGLFQSSLVGSLFYKSAHPDFGLPPALFGIASPTSVGIQVLGGGGDPDSSVLITGVPMHVYVDSHPGICLGTTITNTAIQQAALSGKQFEYQTLVAQTSISSSNSELSVLQQNIHPWNVTERPAFSVYNPIFNENQNLDDGFPRPSLDKNSVRYSGSGLREPVLASTAANTFLSYAISLPIGEKMVMEQSDLGETAFLGVPYQETKAFVVNGGTTVIGKDSDDRRSYSRGCVDLPRGSSLDDSFYKLDLLLDPVLSNTTVEVTELKFTARYNTGKDNLLSNHMFDLFGGDASIIGVNYQGEEINCGCNSTLSNLQWTDASANQIDDNALDIFSIRYTPGRHPEPNFPINEDEFSLNTSVTTNSGTPGTDDHEALLTVNMDNENIFAQDRPLVDVQVDSFQWDETYRPVSKIQISQREGVIPQIGRDPQTGVSGTNLDFSSQTFEFVSLGREIREGGGVEDAIPGCTDSTAINYLPEATEDNGSCVYCNEDDGWNNFLSDGLSNLTIGPQASISDGAAPFGMGPHFNNPAYLGGTWHIGQIGNAHNHWGYGLDAALDAAGAIAVPYGDEFGDTANPYTEFKFTGTFSPYSVTGIPGFQTFLNGLISQGAFTPDAFTLSFYNIESWYGEDGWAQQYFGDFTIPILGAASVGASTFEIGTMTNQSTDVNNFAFASYSIADNPNGFVPNVTDPLTDGFGQSFLKPGKHYVAVLNISVASMVSGYIDPITEKPVECPLEIKIPYNFWVTFCGCDIPTAPNYVADLLEGSYPWLAQDISFPAGYQLLPQCLATGSRIKRSVDAESAGYCLPLPDPFTCDNFIDACIQTTSAECIPLDNGTGQQDFVGTITVDVYGAYTSNDDADEYAFVLGSNNELFTFNLYLIEGSEWDGTIPDPEEGFFYSFQSEADYQAVGFNPFTMNVLNITFNNLPQGTYIALIEQTNTFYFQDGNACPIQQVGVPVTLLVGGDTDCPDLILGCTDPEATNYNPEAVVDDGSCQFIECTDVFLSGEITSITTTNTTVDCVQVDIDPAVGNEVLVNTLVDQQSGSLTIAGYTDDITGEVSGTFVAGFCQVFNGNAGQAITNLLDLFASPANADIVDTSRTELVPITLNTGEVIGGFLPFDQGGNPILTTADTQGLFAGFYAVMLIPSFVAEQDFVECSTEIVSNFDSISFATVGSTFSFTDCPTPCNDQTESSDCPDHVGGCTDENASNYNPLATFDDGTCNNGGQSECDQNPDDPDCVDCDTAASSGLRTFRDCDEFNETTEGCCDPLACNFDPTVDLCLASRCEYCCDGSDDCTDDPGPDECEDENGNILPDCVQPDCPDPNNPDCDTPIVDPCPGGDCGQPPEAECVILGTCDEAVVEDDDPVEVQFDSYEIEVSCTPDGLGNYTDFGDVQRAAMTCSATEGSKLLFKIKSGVKHDRTDLIKLTLINYLFNFAMNEPCMANCDEVTNEQARQKGIQRSTCEEKWRASGSEVWTPTSTYGKGMTVAVIKFLAGKLRKSYYTSTSAVGSGDIPPYTSIANNKVSKWTPCLDVRGKSSNNPGEPAYVYKFFEFMQKYCEQCFVGQTPGLDAVDTRRVPKQPIEPTGLIDENGNEIKLF